MIQDEVAYIDEFELDCTGAKSLESEMVGATDTNLFERYGEEEEK